MLQVILFILKLIGWILLAILAPALPGGGQLPGKALGAGGRCKLRDFFPADQRQAAVPERKSVLEYPGGLDQAG